MMGAARQMTQPLSGLTGIGADCADEKKPQTLSVCGLIYIINSI